MDRFPLFLPRWWWRPSWLLRPRCHGSRAHQHRTTRTWSFGLGLLPSLGLGTGRERERDGVADRDELGDRWSRLGRPFVTRGGVCVQASRRPTGVGGGTFSTVCCTWLCKVVVMSPARGPRTKPKKIQQCHWFRALSFYFLSFLDLTMICCQRYIWKHRHGYGRQNHRIWAYFAFIQRKKSCDKLCNSNVYPIRCMY